MLCTQTQFHSQTSSDQTRSTIKPAQTHSLYNQACSTLKHALHLTFSMLKQSPHSNPLKHNLTLKLALLKRALQSNLLTRKHAQTRSLCSNPLSLLRHALSAQTCSLCSDTLPLLRHTLSAQTHSLCSDTLSLLKPLSLLRHALSAQTRSLCSNTLSAQTRSL